MRELWLQIASTSGARIYSLATGLAVLALTARWLGPEGRGVMSAALVWTNLLYICSFLSLNVVVMHEASSGRDESWTGRVCGTLLAAMAVMTLMSWLAALALYGTRPQWFGSIQPVVLAIALISVPLLIWEQYGNAILLSIGRLDVYNGAVVGGKTLVLALVVAFFIAGFGVKGATIAVVMGQFVVAAASVPVILRHSRGFLRFDAAMLKRLVIAAAKLHPSTVATFAYAYSGILIVNRFLGAGATGIYQLASQLVEVMLVVPYAANVVLYSRMTQAGVREVWGYQRRVLLWLSGFMAASAAAAAALAPLLIPLAGGSEFSGAVPVFRWLVPGAVMATVSSVMTTQWVGRGMFLQLSIVNMAGLVINLVANITLTPRFGMAGAISAALLAYGSTALANGVLAIRCEAEWRRGRPPEAA